VRSGDAIPKPAFASVVFDADSTLSAIEGIDWLGERRSADVAAQIAELTNQAMDGRVSLNEVYAERVARIRPTRDELRLLSDAYIAQVVPGIAALLADLHALGVNTAIVSGGIRDALLPLATHLGIAPERVFAVDLTSTANNQTLDALLGDQPLATSRGKVTVVEQLLRSGAMLQPAVIVGDGATDAAVRESIGTFIAFTGVVRRPAVVDTADYEVVDVNALRSLLIP
jgi:phosphoserine phosphatase